MDNFMFGSSLMRWAVFGLLNLMLAGCASTSFNGSNALPIATPIQPSAQFEGKLLELEELISRAGNDPYRVAQLYYERGMVFDRLGLRYLAWLNFQRALQLRPDFADAYNFVGVDSTLKQRFGEAYAAFDAAIELSPQLEYAYLNRSIALHYGKRPKLAAEDIDVFYQLNPDDPYRVIWRYFIYKALDPALALSDLVATYQLHKTKTEWGWQIIAYLADDVSEHELLSRATADSPSNVVLAERLCEAYFYLGKQQAPVDINKARYYFKMAAATNVYGFIEHRYALLELDLLATRWVAASE